MNLIDTMRTIVAAEPQLAHDAPALARRIRQEAGVISDVDVLDLLQRLRHDSVGLGLLEPVLSLPGLTDVVVNGPDSCFVDCGQGLQPRDIGFADDAEVRQLATRLAAVAGVRLDDAQPFADGRLTRPDGTRIRLHALLAPPSASGTCISLRVLRQAQTSLEELISNGSIDSSLEHVLRAVVEQRASFLVTGGTGSGKTTLLAALLGCVPATERLLIIEDTPELSPNHPHVVTLVSRRANAEGRGEISCRSCSAKRCACAQTASWSVKSAARRWWNCLPHSTPGTMVVRAPYMQTLLMKSPPAWRPLQLSAGSTA